MQHSRRLFAALALVSLLGCAQAPTKRLAAQSRPVQAVRVYVWAGTDGPLQGAGAGHISQTLRRNGLAVQAVVALDKPIADLAALARAWDVGLPSDGATHAVVLTRQRVDGFGAARYVRYEAVLWDAASRILVWQGTLASAANVAGIDAAKQADRLAGDLLRGLARDGLVGLRNPAPLDAAGAEIPATLVPLQIR